MPLKLSSPRGLVSGAFATLRCFVSSHFVGVAPLVSQVFHCCGNEIQLTLTKIKKSDQALWDAFGRPGL